MVGLILGVLLLYVIQTYLPPMIMSRTQGADVLRHGGGPRDEALPLTVNAGRAKRALANMNEAMMVFLPLALLAVHFGLNDGLAWAGALVFLLARAAYVPAYITAIGLTRSTVWTLGHVGLGMMAVAVWMA
ncbi:MAG: MAPEG family protein [Rhodobacteraceae bacterium]|nr:MAPEG family protein [Paracoccaceae bacterium]